MLERCRNFGFYNYQIYNITDHFFLTWVWFDKVLLILVDFRNGPQCWMASTQFFDGPGLQILQFYVGLLKDKIRVLTTDKKRAIINYAFFLFLFTNKYPESNFPNVKNVYLKLMCPVMQNPQSLLSVDFSHWFLVMGYLVDVWMSCYLSMLSSLCVFMSVCLYKTSGKEKSYLNLLWYFLLTS